MVGAGQVERARGVGESWADPVAGVGVADQAEAGQAGLVAESAPLWALAAAIVGLGAEGDAGDFAEQARGQGRRVGGDLLLGVVPRQVQVEGAVGAGVGVRGPAAPPWGEGGEARGQGPPPTPAVSVKGEDWC